MNYYNFNAVIQVRSDSVEEAKEKLYVKLSETSRQFTFELTHIDGKKVK